MKKFTIYVLNNMRLLRWDWKEKKKKRKLNDSLSSPSLHWRQTELFESNCSEQYMVCTSVTFCIIESWSDFSDHGYNYGEVKFIVLILGFLARKIGWRVEDPPPSPLPQFHFAPMESVMMEQGRGSGSQHWGELFVTQEVASSWNQTGREQKASRSNGRLSSRDHLYTDH